MCIKHVCMSLLWSCDTATSLAVSPPCYSRTNCTYSFGTSAGLSGCHHRGERLSSDDGEQEVEKPHKESEVEVWRGHGWRRGCWSWSLFFCGALPSDHLHQVDIRRVYSGVCNCILSPVLHCQPWKWNLINPDQFLMYKMNWQGFKKGGATIQIRWMIHSHIFAPTPTLNTHTHTQPLATLSPFAFSWIYFSFKGRASLAGTTQAKNTRVWDSACVLTHTCMYLDIHTALILYVSMFFCVLWVVDEETHGGFVSENSTRGYSPCVYGHFQGECTDWTDEPKEGKFHSSYSFTFCDKQTFFIWEF